MTCGSAGASRRAQRSAGQRAVVRVRVVRDRVSVVAASARRRPRTPPRRRGVSRRARRRARSADRRCCGRSGTGTCCRSTSRRCCRACRCGTRAAPRPLVFMAVVTAFYVGIGVLNTRVGGQAPPGRAGASRGFVPGVIMSRDRSSFACSAPPPSASPFRSSRRTIPCASRSPTASTSGRQGTGARRRPADGRRHAASSRSTAAPAPTGRRRPPARCSRSARSRKVFTALVLADMVERGEVALRRSGQPVGCRG